MGPLLARRAGDFAVDHAGNLVDRIEQHPLVALRPRDDGHVFEAVSVDMAAAPAEMKG